MNKTYKPVAAPTPKPRQVPPRREQSLRRLEDEIAVRTYYEFLDDPSLVAKNSEVPSDRRVRASSQTRLSQEGLAQIPTNANVRGRSANRTGGATIQTQIRSTSNGPPAPVPYPKPKNMTIPPPKTRGKSGSRIQLPKIVDNSPKTVQKNIVKTAPRTISKTVKPPTQHIAQTVAQIGAKMVPQNLRNRPTEKLPKTSSYPAPTQNSAPYPANQAFPTTALASGSLLPNAPVPYNDATMPGNPGNSWKSVKAPKSPEVVRKGRVIVPENKKFQNAYKDPRILEQSKRDKSLTPVPAEKTAPKFEYEDPYQSGYMPLTGGRNLHGRAIAPSPPVQRSATER